MNDIIAAVTEEFSANWPFFVAQVLNFLVVVGLFALAARVILKRGRGWEVPVWLVLSFVIPVIVPIIALIHFRRPKVILSFADAKKYFLSMGCSHFHMAREDYDLYDDYRALNIAEETERKWTGEQIDEIMLLLTRGESAQEELWAMHSRLSDLVIEGGFKDKLEPLYEATSLVGPTLPKFDRLLMAEAIVGREEMEMRSGLIFKCHDSGLQPLAERFVRLAEKLVEDPFSDEEDEASKHRLGIPMEGNQQRWRELLDSLAKTAAECNVPAQ